MARLKDVINRNKEIYQMFLELRTRVEALESGGADNLKAESITVEKPGVEGSVVIGPKETPKEAAVEAQHATIGPTLKPKKAPKKKEKVISQSEKTS